VDIVGLPISISTDYDMSGSLYGGYIGYNYQMGRTVLGIEGTWSASDINGNTGCVVIFNCKRHVESVATLAGRLGYAMDRTMIYGLAGFAWADVETAVVGNIFGLLQFTGGQTHTGWVVGMGIEHAVASNIVARIEYNHISLGGETHNLAASFSGIALPGVTIPTKVDLDIDTIKVGVGLKFN
jgi:outer membrane immunogenic protein